MRGADSVRADPLEAALRIVSLCSERGALVRLMGGLAFHARVPGWTAPVDRAGRDIDLATRHEDRARLSELLSANGYSADRQYNALHGHKQLYFVDGATGRPLDVLVDRLEMCHRLDLRDRLALDSPTLALADLLLSKLQIVRINRKDVLDALVLLRHYPLGGEAHEEISVGRITDHTSNDWGWWRTVTGNLDTLERFVADDLRPVDLDSSGPDTFDVSAQLRALRDSIDRAPKSTSWRVRATIGDRVRWYQEPEETGHPAARPG